MSSELTSILAELKTLGSEKNKEGMKRFGINTDRAFGVSVPAIRQVGKKYKKNHALALELWESGYHEARILAAIIDDPVQVTPDQMDEWILGFNSWDLCDTTCSLFDKTPHAVMKIKEWTKRETEFEKRAGFALMATLAWHSKTEPDQTFIDFLPIIEREAWDERNYVEKAINWALREIGKRNANLAKHAVSSAERIAKQDHKAAKWIAADALREFKNKGLY
jgi:3-methyladenine DNA glycosylase AlkD